MLKNKHAQCNDLLNVADWKSVEHPLWRSRRGPQRHHFQSDDTGSARDEDIAAPNQPRTLQKVVAGSHTFPYLEWMNDLSKKVRKSSNHSNQSSNHT